MMYQQVFSGTLGLNGDAVRKATAWGIFMSKITSAVTLSNKALSLIIDTSQRTETTMPRYTVVVSPPPTLPIMVIETYHPTVIIKADYRVISQASKPCNVILAVRPRSLTETL